MAERRMTIKERSSLANGLKSSEAREGILWSCDVIILSPVKPRRQNSHFKQTFSDLRPMIVSILRSGRVLTREILKKDFYAKTRVWDLFIAVGCFLQLLRSAERNRPARTLAATPFYNYYHYDIYRQNIMMKLPIVFALLLVLALSLPALAQDGAVDLTARCETFDATIAPLCTGRIKNTASVFATDKWTQQALYDHIKMNLNLATIACGSDHTLNTLCNGAFKECIDVPVTGNLNGVPYGTISVFVSPCYKDCAETSTSCFQNVNSTCNGIYNDSNVVDFPVATNTFDLTSYGGPKYPVACLDINTVNSKGEVKCPAPLLTRPTNDTEGDTIRGYTYVGGSCIFPCPSPFFTNKQWQQFHDMVYIMGIISFICTSIILFTYAVLNRRYDRHAICIIFLSFSLWLIMLTDMVFIGVDYDLLCPEPGRFARQFDSGCASTGVIFQFAAVSAIMWWSTMSFDLWMVIKRIKGTKTYEKYYIIVINVIAIILTGIPAIKKQYGYGIGGLGCWILDNSWQNGVFWGPLTVCLLVGMVFIGLILKEVYDVVKRVDTGRTKTSRIIRYNLKPFIIVVLLFLQFSYLFVYHFWIQDNTPRFNDAMVEYVMCVTTGATDCVAKTIPFPAQFLYLFFLRLLGIEVLVLYGLNSRTKKIWANSFFFHNRFYHITFSFKTSMSSTHTSKDGASTQMRSTAHSISRGGRGGLENDSRRADMSFEVSEGNINNNEEFTNFENDTAKPEQVTRTPSRPRIMFHDDSVSEIVAEAPVVSEAP
eukprot:gene3489-3985_t